MSYMAAKCRYGNYVVVTIKYHVKEIYVALLKIVSYRYPM